MTLLTELAIQALQAGLTALTTLPDPTRNDVSLAGFTPTATPGVNWKLAIVDGDIGVDQVEMGEPEVFELSCDVELMLAVEGQPGPARAAVVAGALEALGGFVIADRTLGGACEDLHVAGNVERDHLVFDNAPPIETARLKLTLILTAPTPLG